MAEYRTVKMSFWTDPYIEGLSSNGKLLYLYLFTCPLVNNLGYMETSIKRIAYETGIADNEIADLLKDAEEDGKIIRDGNCLWITNFIKNQCTTSPKLLQSMKDLLKKITSAKIRHSICIQYPHIFEEEKDSEYRIDTVSIPYQDGTTTVDIPSGELRIGIGIKENTSYSCQNQNFDAPSVEEKPAIEQGTLVDQPVSNGYPQCPQEKILAIYKEILPELPQPRKIRPNLAVQVRARWLEKCREKGFSSEEDGLKYFRNLFEYISGNDFLTGRKNSGDRRWRCDYAWIMKAANFDKITNGYYGGQA